MLNTTIHLHFGELLWTIAALASNAGHLLGKTAHVLSPRHLWRQNTTSLMHRDHLVENRYFVPFFIFYTESVMLSPRFILKSVFYTQSAMRTVPLKCKLTVSTRNSILEVFGNRESSFEARVSSFDFRGSRTKFRGSSFETIKEFFEDLEQRFQGND